MSFFELGRRVNSLAAGLSRRGIDPGDRVLVVSPLGVNLVLAACAAQRLGATLVTCRSWGDPASIGRVDVPIKCVIASPVVYQAFGSTRAIRGAPVQIIVDGVRSEFDGELSELSSGRRTIEVARVHDADESWLCFAPRSKTSYGALADLTHTVGSGSVGDSALATTLLSVLLNLAAGVTSVLPPVNLDEPDELDGQLLIEQMRVNECSSAYLPASLVQRIASTAVGGVQLLPALSRITTYGAPLKRQVITATELMFPRAELYSFFGVQESWPIARLQGQDLPNTQRPGVCIGALLPNLEARLIHPSNPGGRCIVQDWADWESDPGKAGELVIYDPIRSRAYAARESVLIGPDRRPWYRTGQLVAESPDGYLWWQRELQRPARRAPERREELTR
ncbi:MAG: AMP-binding protein [Myxococcota bacterium]